MEQTTYLITEREFLLLAAAAGIDSLYGFELKAEAMDRENSIYTLQELTGKLYMEATENGFKPAGVMDEIFSVIKDAVTVLEVHKKSGKTCILYIGDQSVHVAKSARREETFEIGMIPFGKTWDFLVEEGWIQEPLKQGMTVPVDLLEN